MKNNDVTTATIWNDAGLPGCEIVLCNEPPKIICDAVIGAIDKLAKSMTTVLMPFDKMISKAGLDEDGWWHDKTGDYIEIPIGHHGIKVQSLILGRDMAEHGLIVGQTGAGKTNLMHIMICSAAVKYNPNEIELYLIDFKQGVAFNNYAMHKLPQAKVVAIESDREYGLSVLKALDEELNRRSDIFIKAQKEGKKAEKISEYRVACPKERMPRILLIIDEYQEFFIENDNIQQEAKTLLFDRLIRQGRSYGIHVFLGSQTLTGAASIPSGMSSQMKVRIALQCSESDSRLILADDNSAAKWLNRAGQAIYNDRGGLIEGNKEFQISIFPEETQIDFLKRIRTKANRSEFENKEPVVFIGNEPSNLDMCEPIKTLLASGEGTKKINAICAWLGDPVAIKDPLPVKFKRISGCNLLIVSRDESEGVGIAAAMHLGLLAGSNHPKDIKFIVFNYISPDSTWIETLEKIKGKLQYDITIASRRELSGCLERLVEIIDNRNSDETKIGENIFVFVLVLHRAKDLRKGEPDFSAGREVKKEPSDLFMKILKEGPEVGVHTIVWTDIPESVIKVDRRALNEFSLRVASRMSQQDSTKLLDDNAASKLDKPYRMIFYDEDNPGNLEKFKPYALPAVEWLDSFIDRIAMRK